MSGMESKKGSEGLLKKSVVVRLRLPRGSVNHSKMTKAVGLHGKLLTGEDKKNIWVDKLSAYLF